MLTFYQINRSLIAVIGILLAVLPYACDPPVQELKKPEPDPVSEQFIRANHYMYQRHQDHIAAFVERIGWEAKVTPTGLWIVVENPGVGKQIEENNRVVFTFESTLLDGTPCYRSGSENPKKIIVGKGDVESGVEEGIKHLHEGSEAVFLIPPHLAHGNFGDRDKIPGNSVIIYHLKILDVQ